MAEIFEAKKRIVESGKSSVFNDWARVGGITMHDFIDALKWLCDDPCDGGPRKNRPVRAIGLVITPQVIRSEIKPQNPGIHHLKRAFLRDGGPEVYDMDDGGHLWGGPSRYQYITINDRI